MRQQKINLWKIQNLRKMKKLKEEMAPQVGLEPTTCGLTVRRSNRLSY